MNPLRSLFMNRFSLLFLLSLWLCGLAACNSAPDAMKTDPGAESQRKRQTRERQLRQDWPNLARYREANAQAGMPAEGENRVVFMGDSITDFWIRKAPEFFAGKPYFDRGISGQTSPQMLLRFRQDVIDLHPKVVVILAGINDIAGNTGQATPKMIEDNLQSMAELAQASGIRPVLASILPAAKFGWSPELEPGPQIAAINAWIKGYADRHHFVYLDYYSAMVDGHLGLPTSLANDGVHPNEAGYATMAPLAEEAIARALKGADPRASQ